MNNQTSKTYIPNSETEAAIREGQKIDYDDSVQGYSDISLLRKALDAELEQADKK